MLVAYTELYTGSFTFSLCRQYPESGSQPDTTKESLTLVSPPSPCLHLFLQRSSSATLPTFCNFQELSAQYLCGYIPGQAAVVSCGGCQGLMSTMSARALIVPGPFSKESSQGQLVHSYFSVCVSACHCTCVEVRGQLEGICSLYCVDPGE